MTLTEVANLMKKLAFILTGCMLILAGCGGNQTPELPPEIGQMIDVELSIEPSNQLTSEQQATIKARVTLGNEPVTNADEVVFEIYEAGHKEMSEEITGSHEGDGVYVMHTSFEKESLYYVISHVTVGAMHNMPKQEIIVGQPDNLEELRQLEGSTKHDPHGSMEGH